MDEGTASVDTNLMITADNTVIAASYFLEEHPFASRREEADMHAYCP
jgi:hypothetical protein